MYALICLSMMKTLILLRNLRVKSFLFSGLDTYGFNACMEQVKKVISQADVHKPGKTLSKNQTAL